MLFLLAVCHTHNLIGSCCVVVATVTTMGGRKRTRSQSEALQVGIRVSGLKDENDKPMAGLFLEAGQAKKGDFLAFFVGS